MEYKKENRPTLEYTNGDGTQTFSEGDAVICFTEHKVYRGTIVAFSRYEENEGADSQYSVYLDTSKNIVDCSCEIIKAEDIAYMCRVPMNDLLEYPQTDETLDREVFTNMIIGLGYDKEKAEAMYGSMRKLIALYNAPLASILASVIRELELDADIKDQNELFKVNNRLMCILVQAFDKITKFVMEIVEDATASQDGSDSV